MVHGWGKSEKNFILLRDALDHYPTEVIRHFLISAHYRHPLDYNQESLTKSEGAVRRLNNCLDMLRQYDGQVEANGKPTTPLQNAVHEMKSQFTKAMDTDFNTAQALGAIFTLVSEVNKALSARHEVEEPVFADAYQALTEICQVLGIHNAEAQEGDSNDETKLEGLVELLLAVRQEARNRKDWEDIR